MAYQVKNAFELIQNEIASKRSGIQNLDEKIFRSNSDIHPKPASIIKISGNDNSGKTTVLQYLMARVLMPQEFGGKHCRVIFLDLKHKLKPENLLRQIEMLIRTSHPTESTLSAEECNEIALDCLNAVVLINCYTSEEFLLAVNDVEHILMDDEKSEIGLIAIDGLDAFYWLDVYDRRKRMRTHYTHLIEKLRSICVANNICCCHTVSSNYLEAKGPNLKGTINVEYSLVLSNILSIGRTLNGVAFEITENGITTF